MSISATMTLRLKPSLKNRLEKLAKTLKRTKSFLASQAIDDYVKINEWQLNEIKHGIAEAKRGEFIEHAEILKEWEEKLANSLDKKG